MSFTDTHCHISLETYNIDKIIENARNNNVFKFINNGCDYNTNEDVVKISSCFPNIYSAIGFHPQNLDNFDKKNMLNQIEKNINNIVAIGEIGLDYYNGYEDRGLQREIFREQLKLAEKYNKPVIVHSREATEDTIKILKEFPNVKGSIHCFSGSLETARIYIKMGYKLGIGGVLTFKNSKLYQIVEQIPLESIILETDCPYLAPEPVRGTKNEPANILYIAQKIAEIKKVDLNTLSKITENNVSSVFDI